MLCSALLQSNPEQKLRTYIQTRHILHRHIMELDSYIYGGHQIKPLCFAAKPSHRPTPGRSHTHFSVRMSKHKSVSSDAYQSSPMLYILQMPSVSNTIYIVYIFSIIYCAMLPPPSSSTQPPHSGFHTICKLCGSAKSHF